MHVGTPPYAERTMNGAVRRPKRGYVIDRWAGTLGDVADAAEAAITAFAQAGHPKPHVSLGVHLYEHGTETELDFDDVAAFRHAAPSIDLATIYEIHLMVWVQLGGRAIDDLHLHVTYGSLAGGVEVSVDGPTARYEQFVVDASEQVLDIAKRGNLPLPQVDRTINAASVALTLASVVILAVTDRPLWIAIGLILVFGGALSFLAKKAIDEIFPRFELLDEGEMSRGKVILRHAAGFGRRAAQPTYAIAIGAIVTALILKLV
jgi:hypothetical protein